MRIIFPYRFDVICALCAVMAFGAVSACDVPEAIDRSSSTESFSRQFEWGVSIDEVAMILDTTYYGEASTQISIRGVDFLGVNSNQYYLFSEELSQLEAISYHMHYLDDYTIRNRSGCFRATESSANLALKRFDELQIRLNRAFGEFEADYIGLGPDYSNTDDLHDIPVSMKISGLESGQLVLHTVTRLNNDSVVRHFMRIRLDGTTSHFVSIHTLEIDNRRTEELLSSFERTAKRQMQVYSHD